MYPLDALDRVRLIRRALGVGFSLPELAKILKVRDGGGAPCRQVKRLLEEKLGQVNDQIMELTAMREHLGAVLEDWDRRLEGTPDGKPARLLESLGAAPRTKQTHLKGKTT
jgi:DNA-binding transcriptional MerR regulator